MDDWSIAASADAGPGAAGAAMCSSPYDAGLMADVHIVVHAHPRVAPSPVSGLDFMDDVLPETIFHFGGEPLVPYATPGTSAIGDALEPCRAMHDAFLLDGCVRIACRSDGDPRN